MGTLTTSLKERDRPVLFNHVTGNQTALHQRMRAMFTDLRLGGLAGVDHVYVQETDDDHGQVETRRLWVIRYVELLNCWGNWRGMCGRRRMGLRYW